jgi:hypothetical protein
MSSFAFALAAVSFFFFFFLLPSRSYAGVDVPMNADLPGTVQNEVRITQNPSSPSNFVVAYNDSVGGGSSPLGISYSTDGGANWTDTQLGVPMHPVIGSPDDGISLSVIFDPFIGSDSQGNIYAGYIATDGTLGGPSGLYIECSSNQGQAWSGPINIDFNARAASLLGDPNYRFNDRPHMTVDGSDNLSVVWIKDVDVGQPTSDIYYAKSPPPLGPCLGSASLDFTGAGAGSVAPKTVNDFPGGSVPPGFSDFANVPNVAVAPNGTIYVAWIDVNVTNPASKPGTLMIDSSTDGGMTFGIDNVAQNITALASRLSTASGVGNDVISGSYPVIGVDPNNSTAVYMVYAADPPGPDEADIFFTKSTNGGLSWTTPIRVNDDTATNDQFHPWMAVKSDGTIDVVWYDKRNSANDDQWDVYFTKSTDGGASFLINTRITDQSSTAPTDSTGTVPWLGEYLGLVVDSTNAYIALTSGISDSKGDVFFDSLPNSPTTSTNCDIKPGSDPNSINLKSRDVVPVAVLGTTSFDVQDIDETTVVFGPSAATEAHKALIHFDDVDSDGDQDAVFHFRTQNTGIQSGDTQACISWTTNAGNMFTCCDSVRTIPP